MLQTGMRGLIWAIAQSGVVAVALAIGLADGAIAQIVPDDTLGAERSQVTPDTVGNRAVDRIAGGARRGSSLFHSFRSFNIGAGQRVYFNNPTGVRNILSRVTGNDVSNILGTLGVDGNANLFLLNPNGIVFGQDAQLDMRGSFLATTADRFVFPNQITFGAVNPEAPPLLNVTVPIGLQYGRNPGAIESRATLAVDSGRSLVLAGGAIDLTNSQLGVDFPQGGRIELGSVGNAGTVDLDQQGNLFSLSFPANLERADISLRNSILDVRVANGGDIAITGRSISVLAGSRVRAGIATGYGSVGSQAGDITLNAARTVWLAGVSLINNRVAAATNTDPAGVGNAGDIRISTDSLVVRDGAQLVASTFGRGNAGNVVIEARDRVLFEDSGTNVTSSSGGNSSNGQVIRANGRGGDVQISTGSLTVRDGAKLDASTFGRGNAGNVMIEARDHVLFEDSGTDAFSRSGGISGNGQVIAASGKGGDVRISTDSLTVRNGAKLDASTFGRGNAGNVVIEARDRVLFEGSGSDGSGSDGSVSNAFSSSGNISSNEQVIRASGRGGDIRISTGILSVRRGAALTARTLGRGKAGNVVIEARDRVLFEGSGSNVTSSSGGTFGRQVITANGRGGDVRISTGDLSVLHGAQLVASTFGRGNAGSVVIEARDRVLFEGNGSAAASSSGGIFRRQVIAASGRGGDVRISTGSLTVRDGTQLSASTTGRGNAGSVVIEARARVLFEGSGSAASGSDGFSSNRQGIAASGRGGDIRISSNTLSLHDGALLTAEATGTGNAGDIILNVNQITLDRGTISTQTESSDGGNITLQNADLLTLLHGSRISTSAGLAQASGNGGNITLNANLIAASANDNNDITANAFNGRGGAVNITGQLAGISLLSRNELQARLGTTNSQNLDPSDLPTNDITAVSQNAPTLNGQVTVNPPNVDPSRGLVQLPTTPIDATRQIASACPTNTQQADRLGSFIVSGRGGLPPSPTDLLNNDNTLTEWVTAGESGHVTEVPAPAPSQAIVEAQGWVKEANGEIRLIAAPPTSASTLHPENCRSHSSNP